MGSKEVICQAIEETCGKYCKFNNTRDESHRCDYMREHNGACYLDDLELLIERDEDLPVADKYKLAGISGILTAHEFCMSTSSSFAEKVGTMELTIEKIKKIIREE